MPHPPYPQNPPPPLTTRRDVLRGMAGMGLLALGAAAGTLPGCATTQSGADVLSTDPETAQLIDSVIGIDLHSHAAGANSQATPLYDLAAHLQSGRMTAVCLAHSGDNPVIRRQLDNSVRTVRQPLPGELWQYTQRRLRWVDDLMRTQNLRRALKRGDLEAAHRDRAAAIVQAIEGAQFLEGKLERIEEVYQRGVRHLQLIHFFLSQMGDNQTEPATQGGLTAFGREAIAECNRIGMVIDVAHATMEFVELAAKLSKTPLILSHTAVLNRQPDPFSRRISPEHAKLIADTGGVVGIWGSLAGFKTLGQYVEGLARAVDVAGVDHVGFGTDNSGFGRVRAVWDDYRDFPLVVQIMRKRGFAAEDIRKIAGGNYVRVFNQSVRA